MKVAFTRNRLRKGGIFQVMAEMIYVLNCHNIVPDIVTLASDLDQKTAKESYGQELNFNVVIPQRDLRIPYEWHILWFNYLCSKYTSNYDVVINHNNTSFLHQTSKGQTYINYIHFPRKQRVRSSLRSIHLPDGRKKGIINFRNDFFNIASRFYSKDQQPDERELFLSNSLFTKSKLLETYNLSDDDVQVMYPPVKVSQELTSQHSKDQKLVVSLGRFSKEKRQLEQLKIARLKPELKFILMGFISDQSYWQKCNQYVHNNNLKNVTLLANEPFETINDVLRKASIFIHSIINEPFGITPVQAINHGCLPLVHNSGGQREVINDQDLRYISIEDAEAKLKEISSLSITIRNQKVEKLHAHVSQFSRENFRNNWTTYLNNLHLL